MLSPTDPTSPEKNQQPLPFGVLLNAAFHVLAEHITPIAVLAAVVVFPISIWEGALPSPTFPTTLTMHALTPSQIRTLTAAFMPWAWPLLADLVASYLMTAAAAYLIAEAIEGRSASPFAAYAQVLRRLAPLVTSALAEIIGIGVAGLVVVGLLSLISPFLAVLAVFILAIAAAVYLGLTVQVVMREGLGDVRAPIRSLQLMRGSFWPTLGTLAVAALALVILSSLSALPLSAGVSFFTRALAEVISDLITITVGMLPVTILTVVYEHKVGRVRF